MGSIVPPVEGTLVVQVDQPLVTSTPDEVMRAFRVLHQAVQRSKGHTRAQRKRGLSLSLEHASLDPGGLLLVHYTVDQLAKDGWRVYAAGEEETAHEVVKQHLHLFADKEERAKVHRLPGDFMMRAVSSPEEMVREIEEWAGTVRDGGGGLAFTEEDVARWQTQVGEVVANAFQHGGGGKTRRVVLVGHATSERANLAALDDGPGIPSVIRSHAPSSIRNEPGSLISHACSEGATSRCSRHNQGRGLFDLVNAVKDNDGSLRILSDGGMSHVKQQRLYRRNTCMPPLKGTLVLLSLQAGSRA